MKWISRIACYAVVFTCMLVFGFMSQPAGGPEMKHTFEILFVLLAIQIMCACPCIVYYLDNLED